MPRWSHRGGAGAIATVALSFGIAVWVPHLQASIPLPDRLSRQTHLLSPPEHRPLDSGIPERKCLLSITVDFDMGPGDEGLLLVGGDDSEVFRLYVKNGKLVWTHDYVLRESIIIISSDHLPTGPIHARCEFDSLSASDASRTGDGKLLVNGQIVGPTPRNSPSHVTPVRPQSDTGAPEDSFTGTIRRVALEQR